MGIDIEAKAIVGVRLLDKNSKLILAWVMYILVKVYGRKI